MKSIAAAFTPFLLALSTALAEPPAPPLRAPLHLFAGEPRGSFEVGTFEALWVDETREDSSTANPHDVRKVMVQVWYPATLPKKPRRAPYALSPQLYGNAQWLQKRLHVQTESALNAPAAPGSFPVLIYNHGAGHPHFSATFQTEFLASHGYVVASVGHPGANGLERFPDGTAYVNDGIQWMAEKPRDQSLSPRDQLEHRWRHSDLRLFVEDVSFVLDRLAILNADARHRLYGRLDLDRVGSLGWSLGGMVSLQAARDEPRIKAAVNLDGWPYGLTGPDGVVTRGVERPVLLMFSGEEAESQSPSHPGGEVNAADLELALAAAAHYWTLLRRSTADWYHLSIARTNHGHFSDGPLFSTPDPRDLHPRAAHAIINGYTLEFFEKYVRGGQKDTPLLSGKQHFPEARLLRRR